MSRILLQRTCVGLPLLGSTVFAVHTLPKIHLYDDKPFLYADSPPRTFKPESSSKEAHRDSFINARTARQISAGSIAGVCGGLAVSVFSKPIAVLIGVIVVVVQALESRGIHVVPYKAMEKWFRGIRVESLVKENVPFKLCFGTTFALAAAGSF